MKSEGSTDEVVEGLDVEKVDVLVKDIYHQVRIDIVLANN